MSPFHRLFLDVIKRNMGKEGKQIQFGWMGKNGRRQWKTRVKGFTPLLVPGD